MLTVTSPKKGGKAKSGIALLIGKTKKKLSSESLQPDGVTDIVAQIAATPSTEAVTIDCLAKLTEMDPVIRYGATRLWRSLKQQHGRVVKLVTSTGTYPGPIEAVAVELAKAVTPEAQGSVVEAAAAVITVCSDATEQAFQLQYLEKLLAQHEVSASTRRLFAKQIKQRLKTQQSTPAVAGNAMSAFDTAKLFLDDRYSPSPMADAVSKASVPYDLARYSETFFRRRAGVWIKASDEDIRLDATTFVQGLAPDRCTTRFLGDVLGNVKGLTALSVDGTPPTPFHLGQVEKKLLAFGNGVLDLTTLAAGKKPKLLSHDRQWFSESLLPYEFDAAAKCPQFRKFLGQVLNADPVTLAPLTTGDNRVLVVQEMAGYLLLPDNRFQKFFVLVGDGGNGKGTLLDILKAMIGPENCSTVSLDGMGRQFGTWPLVGKLANLSGDMAEIDAVQEGLLKTWTGEDRTTVERKHLPPIQVDPTLKFIFATNTLPWFRDKTNGVWRRLVVIPFKFAPSSTQPEDPMLRAKLKQELPGILNWALAGLARLLSQGGFTACDFCSTAAQQHREDCSPVREFVTDHFSFAHENPKPLDYQWTTTTTQIRYAIREHNEKSGDKPLATHVVCRVLASMPGVYKDRPKTFALRKETGAVYHGVCLGAPKLLVSPGHAVVPDTDEFDEEEETETEPVKPLKKSKPLKNKGKVKKK